MRFFADQDVYFATVQFLRDLGHDVLTAAERGMSAASDEAHLESAVEHSRIFVTSDSDYGNLVFVRGLGAGVIYLRVRPSTIAATHRELERVLTLYAMDDMLGAFIVIEPGRHRKRIAPGESQSAEN